MTRGRLLLTIGGLLVVGFVVLQVFPIGSVFASMQRVDNPAARQSFDWPSAEVDDIMRRACYDCHSNETVWPWYGNIAPGAWLMTRHVNQGRTHLNFSELDWGQIADAADFLEHARFHIYTDMPPRAYKLLHPDAILTDEQRELVLADMVTLLGISADE